MKKIMMLGIIVLFAVVVNAGQQCEIPIPAGQEFICDYPDFLKNGICQGGEGPKVGCQVNRFIPGGIVDSSCSGIKDVKMIECNKNLGIYVCETACGKDVKCNPTPNVAGSCLDNIPIQECLPKLFCGDDKCSSNENCNSCTVDCGECNIDVDEDGITDDVDRIIGDKLDTLFDSIITISDAKIPINIFGKLPVTISQIQESAQDGQEDVNGSEDGNKSKPVDSLIEKKNLRPLVEFEFDFDRNKLDLTKVKVEKQKKNQKGAVLVKGLKLEVFKTVFVDNTDPDINTVCVKDSEVETLDEISNECASNDEILLTCNGRLVGDLKCEEINDHYKISGLKNSAVREQAPIQAQIVSVSSGGGGGSRRTTNCNDRRDNDNDGLIDLKDPGCVNRNDDDETDIVCKENWVCSSWSKCTDKKSNRVCLDENNCGTSLKKPIQWLTCEDKIVEIVPSTETEKNLETKQPADIKIPEVAEKVTAPKKRHGIILYVILAIGLLIILTIISKIRKKPDVY